MLFFLLGFNIPQCEIISMECTLCHLRFSVISELKKHYVDFHDVDDSNPYFLELFQPDTLDRKCKKCCVVLVVFDSQKKH